MQTGNMYKRSFGHAGSPYELWPIPLANLAFNTGSVKSGKVKSVQVVCMGGKEINNQHNIK
jgi:hypothetical protein